MSSAVLPLKSGVSDHLRIWRFSDNPDHLRFSLLVPRQRTVRRWNEACSI